MTSQTGSSPDSGIILAAKLASSFSLNMSNNSNNLDIYVWTGDAPADIVHTVVAA